MSINWVGHLDAQSKRPTLIAGDMNEWSLNVGLGRLAHRFDIYSPGKSYHARLPLAALDRIAVDDALHVMDGGVCETEDARRASDHLHALTVQPTACHRACQERCAST